MTTTWNGKCISTILPMSHSWYFQGTNTMYFIYSYQNIIFTNVNLCFSFHEVGKVANDRNKDTPRAFLYFSLGLSLRVLGPFL